MILVKTEATSPTFYSELRHGWRAGLGATLGMTTGLSLFVLTNGFFVKPLGEAFHWTRGQIGLGSLTLLVNSVALPAAGWLSDRYGPRVVGAAGLAFVTFGFLGLAALRGNIATYYLWLLVITVLGATSSSTVLSRPVAEAFDRFRGAGLGICLAFSGVLIALISPTVQAIISKYGWQTGYFFLACLPAIVGLGGVLALVPRYKRSRPAFTSEGGRSAFTMALRDRRFWLMFVAMLSANMCFGGLLGQLPAMLADRGISPIQVGFVMSLLAMAAVCGRLLDGVAMDRLWAPAVACVMLLIPIAGLMLLLEHRASVPRAIVAVFLIGLAQGGEGTTLCFFTARYFGFRAYSSIFGTLAVAIGISLAIGGAMFGLVYDWTKAYDAAIFVAAGGLAVAAICLLSTGFNPRHGEARHSHDTERQVQHPRG
jgi:predicted MFS family arabinose efflux permease